MVLGRPEREIWAMKSEVVLKTVGRGVQAARKAKGWSQELLGERLGLTVNTVSNIERGRFPTDLETVARLAAVLEVPVPSLFEPLRNSPISAKEKGDVPKILRLLANEPDEVVKDVYAAIRAMLLVRTKTHQKTRPIRSRKSR